MKTKITALLFMLLSLYVNAQTYGDGCATPDVTAPDPVGVYTYSVDPNDLASFEPVVYNVFFWGIHKIVNGQEYTDFPNHLNDFLTAVANLNKTYNQFNIFFKYKGYDTFVTPTAQWNGPLYDETGYYVIETISEYSQLWQYAENQGYVEPNSFNVYAYGWGFAGGAVPWLKSTISAISSGGVLGGTMVHEIGHNMDLMHLDNGSGSPDPDCVILEHVTRDPSNTDYNALTTGDRVEDTPASYEFEPEDISICEYVGNKVDCTDDHLPYSIIEPDLRNYLMRFASDCEKKYLTIGQGIRIREALQSNPNGIFSDAQTTIASLYEPYLGSYPMYYPHPEPWQKPLFQPGFNYKFVDCCCEYVQPAPYGDIGFNIDPNNIVKIVHANEINYETIFHPNHTAIIIEEVDVALDETNDGQRCYDNYSSPPIIGGRLIKFNDNVVNGNYIITPQDSTEINNPNLIQNLDPGLYNIEKNYIDGTSDENLIFKEN